jgi:DNA mismatch repair protein MSH6
LDKELLSLKNVTPYDPIRNTTSLVLDGQTLANLEILQNSYDGSDEGTVIKLLNHCVTPFGKRQFKQWLCHPLREVQDIVERQDGVEELIAHIDIQELITNKLRGIPDLERLISRIHAGNCKVKEFLTVLEAFKSIQVMRTFDQFCIACCYSNVDTITLGRNKITTFLCPRLQLHSHQAACI